MDEIQIFKNPLFGEVRIVVINDEPWFVGKDVALALGYAKPENALSTHVDEEDKTITLIQGTGSNYKSNTTIINESGMYSLVFGSRLKTAKEFKHWVTSDVLPTLRKTGSYLITTDQVSRKDLALMIIKAEEEKEKLALENKKQAEVIESQKPAVIFTDAVKGSDSSCLVGELAKLIKQNGYDIGEKRLFKWLRENGYLGSHGERYNIPNQRWAHLFELKKGVRSGDNRVMHTTITTKVNGKGQVYFINLFSKKVGKGVAV